MKKIKFGRYIIKSLKYGEVANHYALLCVQTKKSKKLIWLQVYIGSTYNGIVYCLRDITEFINSDDRSLIDEYYRSFLSRRSLRKFIAKIIKEEE